MVLDFIEILKVIFLGIGVNPKFCVNSICGSNRAR